MKKKVMAVASMGGHWIQLLIITRLMEEHCEMVYVSTHPECATMVEGQKYCLTTDFSWSNVWKLIPSFFKALKTIRQGMPHAIITTGTAPGLVFLLAGKLLGRITIWIDSISNAEQLSVGGRIASKFASCTYTQWKDLATGEIQYAGTVFGSNQ